MSALPSIFVSHGAPTLVVDRVPTREFLLELGPKLPRPKAVLCVSAHWDTEAPRLTGGTQPSTMYDFYGFPDELYEMTYPAPGAPALAERAVDLIRAAGMRADVDGRRGLDHGAWVPLKLMWPQADVPVVQLSVQSRLSPEHHLALGRAIAPLRDEGVLILASGNATHNLRDVFSHDIQEPPVPYAKAFADWLTGRVLAGDAPALADYLARGPEARRNHPSPDHYVPLLVAAGAGGGKAEILHDGYTYGVLSMAAYAWN
jgi:4,5-DOPA dioxygenase extradiol